jgi:hypothetical protein
MAQEEGWTCSAGHRNRAEHRRCQTTVFVKGATSRGNHEAQCLHTRPPATEEDSRDSTFPPGVHVYTQG